MLKHLIREPLIQFLALGGVLFVAYSLFAPVQEPAPERIVINRSVIDSLVAAFQATWKRPPTASERQGLIEDYLAEEVGIKAKSLPPPSYDPLGRFLEPPDLQCKKAS